MSLGVKRTFVGKVQAAAGAHAMNQGAVTVIVIHTAEPVSSFKPGDVARVTIERMPRRTVVRGPHKRAAMIRKDLEQREATG